MELFISTACDETRTFGEGTLMRSVIEERYRRFSYNINLVMRGWDVWKEQVSEDLCVHGLNRERMYEAIAEWFLDSSDLLSLMSSLALPDTHIVTIETENDVIIQFCAHGACYQKMMFKKDDEGGLVISYKDLVAGRTSEWVLDIDELLRYAPSFT